MKNEMPKPEEVKDIRDAQASLALDAVMRLITQPESPSFFKRVKNRVYLSLLRAKYKFLGLKVVNKIQHFEHSFPRVHSFIRSIRNLTITSGDIVYAREKLSLVLSSGLLNATIMNLEASEVRTLTVPKRVLRKLDQDRINALEYRINFHHKDLFKPDVQVNSTKMKRLRKSRRT